MKHNASNRRPRNNRNNRGRSGGGNGRSQVFDSNGPEVRIRGTANQICEKYLTLAKDARSSGDFVVAEGYLQHAEHYQRVINSFEEAQAQQRQQREQNKPDHTAEKGNQKSEQEKKTSNDDLSLPSSILGDEVKVSEQPKATALENA